MSIHTMEEATDGLTPQEVWARRAVYRQARRILIDPSTQYEWNPRGYLERIAFKMGGYIQVLTANGDNGEIGNQFYLLFDETARLIEIEKHIESLKPIKASWVHHVDFYHDGTVGVERHGHSTGIHRIYHPTPTSMRRLENTINGLAWSWRPPTTRDIHLSHIRNRAIAPMRHFR